MKKERLRCIANAAFWLFGVLLLSPVLIQFAISLLPGISNAYRVVPECLLGIRDINQVKITELIRGANAALIVQASTCVPAIMVFLMSSREDGRFKKVEVKKVIGYFLIVYGVAMISNFVAAPYTGTTEASEEYFKIAGIMNLGNPILQYLAIAVCAPLSEELIFRWGIQGNIKKIAPRSAIIISAVIFGLAHGNLFQCAYAIPSGLVLGYVFDKTDNISYTVIIHVLINSISVAASLLLP